MAKRSPNRISSQVTPKSSAITGIKAISGLFSSRSHLLIVLFDTFNLSAISCCVSPLDFRKAAKKVPIDFLSTSKSPSCFFNRILSLSDRENQTQDGDYVSHLEKKQIMHISCHQND